MENPQDIEDDSAVFPNRQLLQIQSQEEWLRIHALRAPTYGDESETNQLEAHQRYQQQIAYQNEVLGKIFEKDKTVESLEQAKEKLLETWASETISILTSHSSQPMQVNLKFLASYSDTIFTMASSREKFKAGLSKEPETQNLTLSLNEFSFEAVQAFLNMLKETNLTTRESSVSSDHIIDSCRLAHYLQCTELLEKIVKILIDNVDSANCLSMCEFADSLDLPSLLEASLGHVMKSLHSVESHNVWNELGPELQDRIQSIQALLKSKNRKSLYFSSFTEYLAVFAEQVQYYQERLAEAQIQQDIHDMSSPGWAYAQSKIEIQAERVETLKTMLQEQKRIFLKRDNR